jgi:hypothetical protein
MVKFNYLIYVLVGAFLIIGSLITTSFLIKEISSSEVNSSQINGITQMDTINELYNSHTFYDGSLNPETNPNLYFDGTNYSQVNLTIVPMNTDGYDFGMNKSRYSSYFKSHISYGDAIQYCKDSYCFTIQPSKVTYRNNLLSNDDIFSSINSSTIGLISNDTISWNNIFNGYDLTYTNELDKLKENLIIHSKPRTPASYLGNTNNVTLDFDNYIKYPIGVDLYLSNGTKITSDILTSESLEFRNSSGDILYYLPEPYAIDSNGNQINGKYRIVFDGNYNSNKQRTIFFYTEISFDWLNSSERVYPVYIDPTITFTTEQVESISVTPLSNNTLVVAWCDEVSDDVTFKVYYTNGTNLTAPIDVDDSITRCYSDNQVSISAFDSTTFVIGWYDGTDSDVSFRIYQSNGTNMTNIIDADTDAGLGATSVSVSTFNSTAFVISWFDETDDDVSFATYWSNGTNMTNIIDTDTNAGNAARAVSVSAFNSTAFIIGWCDLSLKYVSFATYWSNGTNMTGINDNAIDADTDAGTSRDVSVSAFNSTTFVIGWYDGTDADASFRIYQSNGTNMTGIIDADITQGTGKSVSVSAQNSSNFVISWFDQPDADASFAVYNSAGTNLVAQTDSSTTALNYQAVASYSASTGIGFCNQNFVHAYAVSTSVANFTSYYSNGTVWDGNCPVVVTDTCTYSSGNWNVNCNDNCSITSNVDLSGNNITIAGYGNFTISGANITGATKKQVWGNSSTAQCIIKCTNNGCFR